MVFTYWYTQWATKAVQNSPRIILLYWFVGLVGWWCETRWIPIYLMMVNTLKWYPYNRTPCVQDVMVIFQLNYYCSIFFLRNFYQVTSYKMHGWFGSSREKKERRGMVFIHNHISILRRDGFQQNGFMSSLFHLSSPF